MSFSNSSRISVKGHASLTNVSGNQTNTTNTTNTTTIIGNVVHMQAKTTEGEDPMYAEFRYVNKGDIIIGEKLGSGTISWFWTPRSTAKGARKARSLGHLRRVWTDIFRVNLHPDQETPFTAFAYAGYSKRDAEEAWDKDFRRFAHNRKREKVQLFGYNKWDIPMLIFHRDLIPIAHIMSQSRSIWGLISAPHLAISITGSDYRRSYLWLDTKSGHFTEGPMGPYCEGHYTRLLFTPPSHTMEMFEENTCIHLYSKLADRNFDLWLLLATHRFDVRKFLDCVLPERNLHPPYSQTVNEPIPWTLEYPYLKGLWLEPPHHLPLDDIGQLRFDTIYSPQLLPLGRVPFRWTCLESVPGFPEMIMVGEMTCITLDSVQIAMQDAWFVQDWLGETWSSQATRIYNAHQPTCYSPDELLYLGTPWGRESFWIEFHNQQDFHPKTFFDLCDGMIEEYPAVYLFLYPPPLTISEYIQWKKSGIWRTHFWSFDEDGHSEIPEEEYARMDLPNITLCADDRVSISSWPQHVYDGLNKYQRARGFDPNTSDWAKSLGFAEAEIIGGRETNQGSACIQEIGDGESTSSFFEAGAGSGISAFGFC